MNTNLAGKPLPSAIQKPRLLIVEDNVDTQQIYKDIFERENFSVLIADDGQKGLAFAQSTLPDLILLDLMLPKMGGMDILKHLRAAEETRHIPVIIFTARSDSRDMKLATELGATEYSVKALNTPKQMLARVRAILAQSTQRNSAAHSIQVTFIGPGSKSGDLGTHLGLANGFECPKCKATVVLEVTPDPQKTEGHWYSAQAVCSGCHMPY